MEDLTPIPPKQAARMVRRVMKQNPPKATSTELGLAIASLALGVLIAISAVPAGVLLGTQNAAVTLIPLFSFSVIAVILGMLGRRNAMGVAGLVLGFIAIVETVSVYGYLSYEEEQERQALIAQEKEKTRQAEQQRKIVQLKLDQQKAEAEQKMAENRAAELELAKQQEARRKEIELRLARERQKADQEREERLQQEALALQKMEREELERKIREREERRQAEADRKAKAARERNSNLKLLEKLVDQYPKAAQDYLNVSQQVKEKIEEINKNSSDVKGFEVRLKNLRLITSKLSSDDPQKKKYEAEERRIQALLQEKMDYLQAPTLATYDLEPNSDWKEVALYTDNISNLLNGTLQDRYEYTGNRLARIHRAILGAIEELSLQDYQQQLLASGVKLLSPSTNKKESASPRTAESH